jgi:prophage regulatory protein
MKEKLLRITCVMEQTGLAKSAVWLWTKQGKLPQPIKLSARVTVWKQSELNEWIQNQLNVVA